jgi:hypothetical protein
MGSTVPSGHSASMAHRSSWTPTQKVGFCIVVHMQIPITTLGFKIPPRIQSSLSKSRRRLRNCEPGRLRIAANVSRWPNPHPWRYQAFNHRCSSDDRGAILSTGPTEQPGRLQHQPIAKSASLKQDSGCPDGRSIVAVRHEADYCDHCSRNRFCCGNTLEHIARIAKRPESRRSTR